MDRIVPILEFVITHQFDFLVLCFLIILSVISYITFFNKQALRQAGESLNKVSKESERKSIRMDLDSRKYDDTLDSMNREIMEYKKAIRELNQRIHNMENSQKELQQDFKISQNNSEEKEKAKREQARKIAQRLSGALNNNLEEG